MDYNNIILIGTSHIAKESIHKVERAIKEEKPDFVCLELDKKRLFALLNKEKKRLSLLDIKRIGLKGYLFSLIGSYVEEKLGKKVGVSPGSEMLHAFKTAQENKIKTLLIDQDIETTLKRFSKEITWKEKWRFLIDIIKGLIFRKEVLKFDLSRIPEEKLIQKLLRQVKKRYPNLYKVLVQERNEYMAKELVKLSKQNPDKKILVVIGAGHEREIAKLIKKYKLSMDVV